MRCPNKTEDEAGRLRALAEYGLSAQVGLPSLDPIVGMAAKMFHCPVAAVNLIGQDHVFLVSNQGIDEYDDRRDVSFCAHAINQGDVMVIEDAMLDPRFHDNPLVTGGAIRFYAGTPLKSPSGHALGALCIIDDRPHTGFDAEDCERLKELAALASDRLELRRLEMASSAGGHLLEASAATSPNAVICFDSEGTITALNDAAATMFELSRLDAIGRPVDLLVGEGDRDTVHAAVARVLAGDAPKRDGTELMGLRAGGERFPAELYWSRWVDEDGMHFGAIVRDMTDRKREHEALYRLANFDALTGLPNHNLVHEYIGGALAKGQTLSLIVTALEGFRDINNTLGHAAGDQVLQIVTQRLVAAAPDGSLVARLRGNEFAILLREVGDPITLADAARAINLALSMPIHVEGQEVRIAGNCGMAIAPQHGDTTEQLIASANLALFQARSGGGGGGAFMFVPALRAEAVARRMYDAELHRAFEREEFVLFYQPQVRLSDGALVGAEALIRWRHPERGLLAPAAFLPSLEAGSLAEPVGSWIIDTACRQAAHWRKSWPDFTVAVNLFTAQFRDGDLPRVMLAALARHDLESQALELEITENIILDRQDPVLAQLKELREAGFNLSFDDFGTGYASLNMLRNFPVTHIKIDKSFTQVLQTSPKDRAIVVSLIELARQLDLKVTAEGVESLADCKFLRAQGCEKGQGYLFGKPVPPDLFEEQFFADGMAARLI